MSYHKNERVNDAIIHLLDALCSWERDTGGDSTLILVPHTERHGQIIVAQGGKPINMTFNTETQILELGLKARGASL
jgi:hypothetical protein